MTCKMLDCATTLHFSLSRLRAFVCTFKLRKTEKKQNDRNHSLAVSFSRPFVITRTNEANVMKCTFATKRIETTAMNKTHAFTRAKMNSCTSSSMLVFSSVNSFFSSLLFTHSLGAWRISQTMFLVVISFDFDCLYTLRDECNHHQHINEKWSEKCERMSKKTIQLQQNHLHSALRSINSVIIQ